MVEVVCTGTYGSCAEENKISLRGSLLKCSN